MVCALRYLRILGCEPEDIAEVIRGQDARKRRFQAVRDKRGELFIGAVPGHSEGSGVAVGELNAAGEL